MRREASLVGREEEDTHPGTPPSLYMPVYTTLGMYHPPSSRVYPPYYRPPCSLTYTGEATLVLSDEALGSA